MASSSAIASPTRKRLARSRVRRLVLGGRGAQVDRKPRAPAPGTDRFLDQWLVARGETLLGLVTATLATIDYEESASGLRRRKRREEDLRTHYQLVESIIANLAYGVIDKTGPKSIAVSLTKSKVATRYDRHIYRQLSTILTVLEQASILTVTKPTTRDRRTTIKPTAWFERQVKAARITFEDFGRSEHEETIILSRSVNGFKADGTFCKQRRLINYQYDTDETRRYRAEMAKINAFLAEAELELASDRTSRLAIEPRKNRTLHRTFNLPPWQEDDAPRFDLGGRLFGGWWENVPSEVRCRIRIEGEAVAELDFASMFPRLAFLKLGLAPPRGDLYVVPGLEDPKHRDGVKGMMNTLLFASGPKLRLPPEFKKHLPRGWTARDVRKAIVDRHSSLEPAFERGLGLELMFMESQILVAVLLRLIDEDIVALPLHDGLITPISQRDRVRAVMEDVSKEVAGFRLPTSEKRLQSHRQEA